MLFPLLEYFLCESIDDISSDNKSQVPYIINIKHLLTEENSFIKFCWNEPQPIMNSKHL